jgi:multidrug resistance efflux pump
MSVPPRERTPIQDGVPAAPTVAPPDGRPAAPPDGKPTTLPSGRPSAPSEARPVSAPATSRTNGHPREASSPTPGAPPRTRRRRLWLLLPILLIVGAIATTLGYRYWYDSTYFVMTENAQVTGDMVQVGSLNAGRLLATRVEVGDQIRQGQEIAVVGIPQQVGAVPFSSAPVLQETGGLDTQVPVRAPLTGIVAARMGSVGGTVSVGQPIYAVVDPTQVWVKANIEEDKVARLRAGQSVEVHVDALGQSFPGRVEAITPASAATFSLLPSGNTSGNFTKVTQLVPVKISVDSGGQVLPLGTSVEVKIQVRQPGGGLPWLP